MSTKCNWYDNAGVESLLHNPEAKAIYDEGCDPGRHAVAGVRVHRTGLQPATPAQYDWMDQSGGLGGQENREDRCLRFLGKIIRGAGEPDADQHVIKVTRQADEHMAE